MNPEPMVPLDPVHPNPSDDLRVNQPCGCGCGCYCGSGDLASTSSSGSTGDWQIGFIAVNMFGC
jgi:hypothetical protein